jgi:uncharacterized protein YqgC (DUF456 family)
MAETKAAPKIGLTLALVGAAGLIISPFLAWAKGDFVVGTFSETGIDAGWGWVTVAVGAIAALVVFAAWRGTAGRVAPVLAVLALVAAGVTVYEFTSVRNELRDAHKDASVDITEDFSVDALTTSYGAGLYLSAVASGVVLIGAAFTRTGSNRQG